MQRISRLRYDSLAGYTRLPGSRFFAREVDWYAEQNERVVSALFEDTTDGDFGAAILARDEVGQFRAVDIFGFFNDLDTLRARMEDKLREWATRPDEDYAQGVGRQSPPLDFFSCPPAERRLHTAYQRISTGEGFSPARELMNAMRFYFEDPDGNFVEQLQTTGFDARLWELYLFAAFTEMGYGFDRRFDAPDFLCRGVSTAFFLEATTVNPTILRGRNVEPGRPDDIEGAKNYMANYMPIKYGSALYSKLEKRYWTLPHVTGKPIILAIQDFHLPGSMVWSEPSLGPYLYGHRITGIYDDNGNLMRISTPITEHRWGTKVIPSNFFSLPDAEHISAVITNAQGTITKFNRIGYLAGFGSRRVRMTRIGTRYAHAENAALPQPFINDVHEEGYTEKWCEGMNIYHNPNAAVPLDPQVMPLAAHHFFEAGQVRSLIPEFHPFGSQTEIHVEP